MRSEIMILLKKNLENQFTVEKVNGGLVHHVYKIFTDNKFYYLKIREDKFAKLNIECRANDIVYEYEALNLYGKLTKDVFPEVQNFFRKENALLLSDVLELGKTLENVFREDRSTINNELFSILAKNVAFAHLRTIDVHKSPRGELDLSYYKNELFYKLGVHKIDKLDRLSAKFLKTEKKLIIGDRSPKNIGINKRKITFFDLDSTCMGNYEYEIGFIIAHICLHTYSLNCIDFINSFLDEYCKINNFKVDFQDVMLVSIGSMLYRLDSPVVPYDLGIDDSQRNRMIANLKKILHKEKLTWKIITSSIQT